jgi:hypothetical protein
VLSRVASRTPLLGNTRPHGPCHAGRGLLHWVVLKSSDKVFEDCLAWLGKLQAASGEPAPAQCAPAGGGGPTRAALTRADRLGDTPMHLAAKSNAAMKVYLMTKLDPWAVMWTGHGQGKGESAFALASEELDKCTIKVKTSEARNSACCAWYCWLMAIAHAML